MEEASRKSMKPKLQFVILLLASLTLSGCIGEDNMSTDEGPAWINETGDTTQHWSIEIDDDEWLEVKSSRVMIEFYRESGNITQNYPYTIQESEGWIVSDYSPVFGGSYAGCYFNSEINDCVDEYYPDQNQGFTVTDWSIIYRVHQS